MGDSWLPPLWAIYFWPSTSGHLLLAIYFWPSTSGHLRVANELSIGVYQQELGLDTSVPDTSVPDTSVPDTSVLDTSVLDTSVPDTSVLDTSRQGMSGLAGNAKGLIDIAPDIVNCFDSYRDTHKIGWNLRAFSTPSMSALPQGFNASQ